MKKGEKSGLIYYLSIIGFFAIFSTTISKDPVLPLYVKALGGTNLLLGLISVFSPLAGILLSFPVGMLSDKIGRKKILIVSGIVFLTAPLLYLLVSNPLWLIPIRFFHGMATAILVPLASSIIVKAYPESKGSKLGIYSSSTLVGRALAPMAGGFIISYFAASKISLANYRYVYLAAFFLAIPVFIMILLSLREDKKTAQRLRAGDFYRDLKYLAKNKRLFSSSLIDVRFALPDMLSVLL